MTTEYAIPFPDEMVLAILDGRKTRTRRLVTHRGEPVPQDRSIRTGTYPSGGAGWFAQWPHRHGLERALTCPYGSAGTRLWVREAWALEDLEEGERVVWRADRAAKWRGMDGIFYMESAYQPARWRASSHMPRWAARITLEVANVKIERVQAITEEDAKLEGVRSFFDEYTCISRDQRITTRERAADAPHRASFAVQWDETYADRGLSWISNPWVWVIDFRVVS